MVALWSASATYVGEELRREADLLFAYEADGIALERHSVLLGIGEDTIVVGMRAPELNAGRAVVYRYFGEGQHGNWSEIAQLEADFSADMFPSKVAVHGDDVFVGGYNSADARGQLKILSSKSGRVTQVLQHTVSDFSTSFSIDETGALAVLARKAVLVYSKSQNDQYELTHQTNLPSKPPGHIADGLQEASALFGHISAFTSVQLRGFHAFVGCRSKARPLILTMRRIANIWQFQKGFAFLDMVTFPADSKGRRIPPEREIVREGGGTEFETVVSASVALEAAATCRNCNYGHSVHLLRVTGKDDIAHKVLADSIPFPYDVFPRQFGTDVSIWNNFLAVIDSSTIVQKAFLFRKRGGAWSLVHKLYKPEDLIYLYYTVAIATFGDDALVAHLADESRIVLLHFREVDKSDQEYSPRPPSQPNWKTGFRNYDTIYWQQKDLTRGDIVKVSLTSAAGLFFLALITYMFATKSFSRRDTQAEFTFR